MIETYPSTAPRTHTYTHTLMFLVLHFKQFALGSRQKHVPPDRQCPRTPTAASLRWTVFSKQLFSSPRCKLLPAPHLDAASGHHACLIVIHLCIVCNIFGLQDKWQNNDFGGECGIKRYLTGPVEEERRHLETFTATLISYL